MDIFALPGVQIAIVLVLVAVVFFGFIREHFPPDVVAILGMGALLLTGILTTGEAMAVFSNPAPITVAAMFVLSAALERTGVIDGVGRSVARLAERWSPAVAVLAMMGAVMVLSAFINNTPVVVILIPVAISLAKAVKIAPSRLLIPLSFASIFGGTTTLIGTSTNILVDGVAQRSGMAPFGMFEITAAGAIMATAGALYLGLLGRWLLPERLTLAAVLPDQKERRFFAHVVVPIDSVLIGKSLAEAGFTVEKGFTVVDIVRAGDSLRGELSSLTIAAGDQIIIRSRAADMLALRQAGDVAFGGEDGHAFVPIASAETVIMEGVIGPHSSFVGRRLADLALRRLYGVYILAVHRRGENMGKQGGGLRLALGDTVLLEGPAASMRRIFEDRALINLAQTSDRPMRRDKAPIAIAAVLLVMGLAAFEVLPIAALALIAATAVVALGCLDNQEAYRAIRWDILMLIFGMLALGLAMEKTGAAALIVGQIVGVLGPAMGPLAVLALVYLITSVLTETMSNNAAAILLTPIAIGLAHHLGVDPRPFVVAVMFAASASFATPIGYQTNTLVYNAGGYKFTDFVRVGLPLNMLMLVVAVLVIPVFWPLTAVG